MGEYQVTLITNGDCWDVDGLIIFPPYTDLSVAAKHAYQLSDLLDGTHEVQLFRRGGTKVFSLKLGSNPPYDVYLQMVMNELASEECGGVA